MAAEPHCPRPSATAACEEDVHAWFELSYSSYLVLPRVLMQAMPAEWQHRFVELLDELRETYQQENDNYNVSLRTQEGTFIDDPFRSYRYPNQQAIEAAWKRAHE